MFFLSFLFEDLWDCPGILKRTTRLCVIFDKTCGQDMLQLKAIFLNEYHTQYDTCEVCETEYTNNYYKTNNSVFYGFFFKVYIFYNWHIGTTFLNILTLQIRSIR